MTLTSLRGPLARALFALAVAAPVAGCCNVNGVIGSVSVPLEPQETNNWCWAATTEMIAHYFDQTCDQCALADEALGRTDCCAGTCPQTAACNQPGWVQFGSCGLTNEVSTEPLSWDDLRDQVYCAQEPMGFAYGAKTGGVGHVLVVNGYAEINGVAYVSLVDPWAPCNGANRFITYTEYSASTVNDHWSTFLNFQTSGA